MEDNTQTTNVNYQSLIDNKDTKFVEKIKTTQSENKPGLGLLASEILSSGTNINGTRYNDYPILVRTGLFGFIVGSVNNNNISIIPTGGPNSGIGFRPVIWVK